MEYAGHKLLLDYRNNAFVARCSCGGWSVSRSPDSGRLADVYQQIEHEHGRHAETARGAGGEPTTGAAGEHIVVTNDSSKETQ